MSGTESDKDIRKIISDAIDTADEDLRRINLEVVPQSIIVFCSKSSVNRKLHEIAKASRRSITVYEIIR